jgi:hypothetical protein
VPRTVNGTGFFRTELKPHRDVSTNTSEGIRTGGEKRANPKLRPCPGRRGTKRAVIVTITSCHAEADGRDGRGEREGDEETIHLGDLRSRTRLENIAELSGMAQNCGGCRECVVKKNMSWGKLAVSAKSGKPMYFNQHAQALIRFVIPYFRRSEGLTIGD